MAMRYVAKRQRIRSRSRGPKSTALVSVSAKQAEMNLARKVVQLSKYVKGLKPEMKFVDLALSSTNVNTGTGLTQLMSAVAAGSNINNRIGENILAKYIEVNFEAVYGASISVATNDNPSYRFYIVQDKQQIGSTSPALSDLIDAPGTPTIALYNVTEQKRFRVIFDSGPQVMVMGNMSAVAPPTFGYSSISLPSKLTWKVKRSVTIPIEFNGTGSTNIQKNGIYLMVQSDMVATATACFDFLCTTRIGFTDV